MSLWTLKITDMSIRSIRQPDSPPPTLQNNKREPHTWLRFHEFIRFSVFRVRQKRWHRTLVVDYPLPPIHNSHNRIKDATQRWLVSQEKPLYPRRPPDARSNKIHGVVVLLLTSGVLRVHYGSSWLGLVTQLPRHHQTQDVVSTWRLCVAHYNTEDGICLRG